MPYKEVPRDDRRGRYEGSFSRSRGQRGDREIEEDFVRKRPRDYDDGSRSTRPRVYEDRGPKNRFDESQDRYNNKRSTRDAGPRIRESFDGGSLGFRRGGNDRRFDRGGRGGGFSRGGFRGNVRSAGGNFGRREKSPAEPSRVLGVFGLSPRTEEPDLYEVFSEFGRVDDIQMVFDAVSGRSRGFGFVYFEDLDSAIAARDGLLEGLELHGRVVRIDYSKTVGAHNPTPGLYMGKNKNRDRVETRGSSRRISSRGGFSSSRGFRGSHGSSRGRRNNYNDRGYRSRSRSVSLTPPPPVPHGVSSNGGRVPRLRTQSSSRSRSPPPVSVPSRRRQMVEQSTGYRGGYTNGGGHGGWTDEEKD